MMGGGDDLILPLLVSYEGDWPAGCTAPSVAIDCPDGDALTGTLTGDRPPTWSFGCSSSTKDGTISASGTLVQVIPGQ
jgi:hypothetical protein